MTKPKLVIGSKAYSSWSLRPWMVLTHFGVAFEEIVVRLDRPDTRERSARIFADRPRARLDPWRRDDLGFAGDLEYVAETWARICRLAARQGGAGAGAVARAPRCTRALARCAQHCPTQFAAARPQARADPGGRGGRQADRGRLGGRRAPASARAGRSCSAPFRPPTRCSRLSSTASTPTTSTSASRRASLYGRRSWRCRHGRAWIDGRRGRAVAERRVRSALSQRDTGARKPTRSPAIVGGTAHHRRGRQAATLERLLPLRDDRELAAVRRRARRRLRRAQRDLRARLLARRGADRQRAARQFFRPVLLQRRDDFDRRLRRHASADACTATSSRRSRISSACCRWR